MSPPFVNPLLCMTTFSWLVFGLDPGLGRGLGHCEGLGELTAVFNGVGVGDSVVAAG